VFDGFITDVVGAEFWWRATQQGVKGPGESVPRTYSEQELLPFLEGSRCCSSRRLWSALRSAAA
jgi:hypothetical protein